MRLKLVLMEFVAVFSLDAAPNYFGTYMYIKNIYWYSSCIFLGFNKTSVKQRVDAIIDPVTVQLQKPFSL